MVKSERDTALRQLLEIYCTFLPQQRAQVEELVASNVPLHTVASLYPLDWRHLHADFCFPHIEKPLNIVLDLVKIYNDAEDDLWEVEGGAYGDEGKAFFAEHKTSDFADRTTRIVSQLYAYQRGVFEKGHIEHAIAALHWYTWTFENWDKLEAADAKPALMHALEQTVEYLAHALDDDFCNLSQVGA